MTGPLTGPLTDNAEPTADEAVADLVDLFDLEQLDVDLYRGRSAPTTRPRVFGGQVAAQALIAGVRSVGDGYAVHSLHSYFLLPGDPSAPIVYEVERIRDGRSFQTRRVVARQHGRRIYFLTASFQKAEQGYDHQDEMPAVAPPEDGHDFVAMIGRAGDVDSQSLRREWGALEARWMGSSRHGLTDDPARPSRSQVWLRVSGRLSDDPVEHLAAFTFASDMSLLGASLAAHDAPPGKVQMASLDHTIWFHRPFRADEWWLYDQWSPSASGARGLSIGRVFTQAGVLVATVAQEGLIRPPRESA